jgi:uncharacterized protein (TIGR03437 family)
VKYFIAKTSGPRLSRRAFGVLAGAGAAASFIPAWNETVEAADSIACVPSTPTVTEGPYWVDEKLFRSDIRTDPSTGVARAGTPLALTIYVQNLSSGSCTPLSGAWVDIWHCDAKGIYSDEATYNPGGGTGSVNTTGQKFLRGYQVTDDNGKVAFTTIYPGWYSGRTIHIHFRVRTYNGSIVLGNFVSQIFFDETTNNIVLAQPAYSRSNTRDTQNSNDMVYNVTNRERMLAATTGNSSDGYAASITVGVTLAVPAAAAPSIASGGIGNAVSGAAGVVAGSWISIYGASLSTVTRALASSDILDGKLPTSLGGAGAKINGKSAYVQYVSPAQINVLAPSDTSLGTVAVTVSNASGTSNTMSASMQSALPGLSTLSGYVRAVRYPDGALVNGTGAAESGYTTSAAIGPGDVLSLFGTGFGPASGSPDTGTVFSGAYPTDNSVTVTIGSTPAEVIWAGLVGPGLYQINVRVPSSLPDGDQPVVAFIGGLSSQSSALLKVAASAKLSAAGTLLRQLMGHGPSPRMLLSHATLEHLFWLGGLNGPAQHAEGGSHLARVSLQAVEQQGGMIQLA